MIISYNGRDCMPEFARVLKAIVIMMINTPQKPMASLTVEEERKRKESNHCHICNEEFIYENRKWKR